MSPNRLDEIEAKLQKLREEKDGLDEQLRDEKHRLDDEETRLEREKKLETAMQQLRLSDEQKDKLRSGLASLKQALEGSKGLKGSYVFDAVVRTIIHESEPYNPPSRTVHF